MLSREKRLLSARDFKRAYQKGTFFGSQFFSLSTLPNRTQNTRLGFVISKKVEPKAVKRNLLKRRFREAAGSLYDLLPSGYDVVVSIKPKAKEAEFTAIKREIEQSFGKVGQGAGQRRKRSSDDRSSACVAR